jgi:lactoylglutathione lyase
MNQNSKPNIRLTVPLLGVANMDVSLRFYTEKLGFEIKNQWTPRGKIEWCWLERDAVALMLQGPWLDEGHPPDTEKVPKSGPSLCYQCEDALALYREFKDRGVPVREPFVGNAMWVVVLYDPDGYKLDFESSTDVAEGTTFAVWSHTNAGI